METANNIAGSESGKAKIAVISISAIALETVLMVLRGGKIEYTILATDQDGKTILQVNYKEDQVSILNEIMILIDFIDEATAAFMPILKATLNSLEEKAKQLIKDFAKKAESKKALNLGALKNQTLNEQKNGNA